MGLRTPGDLNCHSEYIGVAVRSKCITNRQSLRRLYRKFDFITPFGTQCPSRLHRGFPPVGLFFFELLAIFGHLLCLIISHMMNFWESSRVSKSFHSLFGDASPHLAALALLNTEDMSGNLMLVPIWACCYGGF